MLVADLKKEIEAAEKALAALKKEADAAEKEAADAGLTSGTVKQHVRELSDNVTAAQRIRATLKKEHDENSAAVEHGKANVDLNTRSANSKAQILLYEEELANKEHEDLRSRQLLERTAAQYKRVAERQKSALAAVKAQLAELSAALAVNSKPVPLKIKAPESARSGAKQQQQQQHQDEVAEDPGEQLDILADLASSREADLRDAERHLRETTAIAQLKEDEIVRLRAETEQHMAERRKERDEEIKRMVFGFQDDRKALHDDVAEMRRANADQKLKLQRGHVQKVPPANGDATEVFLEAATRQKESPRAHHSRRDTVLKPKNVKSTEEMHLEEHNAEIEDALRAALHEMNEEQKLKSEIAKNIKNMTERMKKDELAYAQRIMQLQAAAGSESAKASKAEAENERLCADVQHFSEVLENTRRNIERVRGHSAPLPIE